MQSEALKERQQSSYGPGSSLLTTGGEEPKDGYLEATQIYYLLTPDSIRGRMHMNLHSVSSIAFLLTFVQTFHVHHAGRALYTLIKPPSSPQTLPDIRRIIMGSNIATGEVTQLFVPGGWWKASELPEEDLLLLTAPGAEPGLNERIGCLISEVVVPGWTIEQHQFIDEDKVRKHRTETQDRQSHGLMRLASSYVEWP